MNIKINFCDFYEGFDPSDNIFLSILRKKYDITLSTEPDFLIYSCFGIEHLKYKNCVKIFRTGENVHPDFNECDYSIGFDDWNCGERHLHFPSWFLFLDSYSENKILSLSKDMAHRAFCNFIYSNESCGEGAVIRQKFCKKLMEYRHVDCPGKVLHNMDMPITPRNDKNWSEGEIEFTKNYKFTIAFENDLSLDYVTEKIIHPFLSQSIPIYLGGTNLKHFNPKSFINVASFDSFDEAIQRIIELDQNDDQYLSMLNEYPFSEGFDLQQRNRLKQFLLSIIDKGNKPLTKDPHLFSDAHTLNQMLLSFSSSPPEGVPSPPPQATKKVRYLLRNLSRKIRTVIISCNAKIRKRIKIRQLDKYHKNRIPFVFLFGVPYHSNLGDQAQTYCIEAWLRKYMPHYGINISMLTTSTDEKMNYIRQYFKKGDIILCHSGYHMTDLYREQDVYLKLTQMFPDEPIRILPQTIHYLNENNAIKTASILNTHPNCTLLCRDEQSYSTAKSLFSGCKLSLYPDIVTSLIGNFPLSNSSKRNGILFCMRNDKEALYSKEEIEEIRQIVSIKHSTEMNDTTVDLDAEYISENRHQVLSETFDFFARHQIVVTDRYHGTIFSLIANTPVIIVNSTDHKLSSGVKWFPESFRDHVYHACNLECIPQLIEEILLKGELPKLPAYFVDNYYNEKLGETLNLPIHA